MKPLRLSQRERQRVGRMLEAQRRTAGLTRAEMAQAIGVHPSEASRILRAKTHLGVERLTRIAAWLGGMSLAELLGRPRGSFPPEVREMVVHEMLRQSEMWRKRGVRFVKQRDTSPTGEDHLRDIVGDILAWVTSLPATQPETLALLKRLSEDSAFLARAKALMDDEGREGPV